MSRSKSCKQSQTGCPVSRSALKDTSAKNTPKPSRAREQRIWRAANPGKVREHNRRAYKRKRKWEIENTEARKKITARYRAHSTRYKKYIFRYRRSPKYRLVGALRARVRVALNRAKTNQKLDHTLALLGCSAQQFKTHIEKQFLPGMSWENYGIYGWHVDHITPVCSFDLSTLAGQQKAFHYTNTQPLWATDNLRKNRY